MTVSHRPFGKTLKGAPVTEYTLENGFGMSVSVLDLGCAVRSLIVPARGGTVDAVLGCDSARGYEQGGAFMGAVVGRVANRIGGGRFELDGKIYHLQLNDGANHLHGGADGFFSRVWTAVPRSDSLSFLLFSPDGDGGYPGALSCAVTYSLGQSSLEISYSALSDADTLCCLSSHCYFNLAGGGDVLSHGLFIDADGYCPTDDAGLADGRVVPVDGTPFDFRRKKPVGLDINADDTQLAFGRGYDHNFVLNGSGLRRAAAVECSDSGLRMEVLTDMPGLQLYTANSLTPRSGKGGAVYAPRSGLCLETQYFPNAINCPDFEPPILRAGERYSSKTIYKFENI